MPGHAPRQLRWITPHAAGQRQELELLLPLTRPRNYGLNRSTQSANQCAQILGKNMKRNNQKPRLTAIVMVSGKWP